MSDFVVKDSGERHEFDSGMVRDVTAGKTNWSLTADGPMLQRYAEHLTKGAEKYDVRNWMKASGKAELDRFRESAFRHFMQWYRGDADEDHAAAVWFNVNGAEYVRDQMDKAVTEMFSSPLIEFAEKHFAKSDPFHPANSDPDNEANECGRDCEAVGGTYDCTCTGNGPCPCS